jgi:hypothetical protein
VAFQVVNGNIPQAVERWLLANLISVDRCREAGGWALHDQECRCYPFAWPHDREPSLQDAIEAVMAQGGDRA